VREQKIAEKYYYKGGQMRKIRIGKFIIFTKPTFSLVRWYFGTYYSVIDFGWFKITWTRR